MMFFIIKCCHCSVGLFIQGVKKYLLYKHTVGVSIFGTGM